MRADLYRPIHSSFLSCEKDIELILRKLFIENPVFADNLKRLLIINKKDCLDNKSKEYQELIDSYNVARLIEEGYVNIVPRVQNKEFEERKNRLFISFDNFIPNASNPEFRDCTVHFDIFCHVDDWNLGDFRLRPFKIAGYIDGLLDKQKLTGIGEFLFLNNTENILPGGEYAGYLMTYAAVHGSDDRIDNNEE